MLKFPGLGKRVGEVAGAVAGTSFREGVKIGVRVLACMVAAHELQTHAGRLLGEAAGEITVFEGDEFDEATAHVRLAAYNVGTQNGACAAWLHASQEFGFPVPAWVLAEVKRLGEAGQWYNPPVSTEAPADDVDEGQADEEDVAEAELVDEPTRRPFPAFGVPRQARETAADAG